MLETVAIFESNFIFLGELSLENGAFQGAKLNDRGEAVLGPALMRWQMHGIPKRTADVFIAEGEEANLNSYRINKNDAAFGSSLMDWISHHGFHAFVLKGTELECWYKIIRLPLESPEQYALLSCIVKGNAVQVSKLSRILDQAVELTENETAQLEEAVKRLRMESAHKLVKKYARQKA